MRCHRSLGAAVVAALIALSAEAGAVTPAEKAEAKALVAEARTASKQKRHADAAAALRKADGLDPNPQTKLDLSRALVETGQLVEASQVLNGIISAGGTSQGAKKVVAASKKLLADVEPRVPWIKIAVIGPDAAQTSTTIDGKEVDAAEEIPFDPGDHTVAAEAEGYERTEKRVSLGEGKHELVKLKLVKLAVKPTAQVEEESPGGSKLPAALAFGVGAAGLAVGGIFGIMAFNETSKVEENCRNGICPADQEEPLSIAKTNGTVSTIGFVVGGVGVLTGVILLITSGGGEPEAAPEGPDAVAVRPWIGPGQAGLTGRF